MQLCIFPVVQRRGWIGLNINLETIYLLGASTRIDTYMSRMDFFNDIFLCFINILFRLVQ